MSNSLNITDLWSAQTANCPLAVGQTAMTVSYWYRIRSFSPTTKAKIFTQSSFPIGNAFGLAFSGNGKQVSSYIKGTTGPSYPNNIVLNQWVHGMMSLAATGVAVVYINGEPVETKVNPGVTLANANSIKICLDQAGAGSVDLGDLAILNGAALGQADALGLRDQSLTPLTTSVPFTSWWKLDGAPGANPTAGDSAMHDVIGSNHFITIPGASPNLSTNAVYSSESPVFTPSITADPFVTKHGLVWFGVGTNPALGAVLPKNVTMVNADPSFKVDGTSVSAIRIYSTIKKWLPGVLYHLYTPGSPATAVALTPSSVVTYNAPSDWVGTSAGFVGHSVGTMPNYVGQYEPGQFGYPSFDPAMNPPTMNVGFGAGGSMVGTSSVLKNIIRRTSNPWSGVKTSTPDGFPLTFTATGVITGQNTWEAGGNNNGIDVTSQPPPMGLWTILADETSPANPIVLSITASNSQGAAITGFTTIPGTIVGGVETNKKWTFNVGLGATNKNVDPNIVLTAPLPHVDGQAQTLTNIRLFQGGDTVETSPGLNISENYLYMLSGSTPGTYGNCVRYLIGADGDWSFAIPEDLRAANDFTYGDAPPVPAATWTVSEPTRTNNRKIPVRSVQRYDPINGNKKVYVNAPYERCVPTDGPRKFMWIPADWGMDYDWAYALNTGTFKGVAIEFTCGMPDGIPVKHNLKAGQKLTWDSTFTISVANANGTGTCTVSSHCTGWPTSEYSFVTFGYVGTMAAHAKAGWVNGTQIVNKSAQFTVFSNSGGWNMAPEGFGAPARATGGKISPWVNINACADDDGVRALAQRMHDSIPRGTKVRLQWSNEPFIPNDQFGWISHLKCLEGLTGPDPHCLAIVIRAAQTMDIFEGVFSDDPGAIIRIFQPWTVSPSNTTNAMVYSQAHSIRWDEVAIAPYVDQDTSPSFTMAAAQLVADDSDSIAHTGLAGGQMPKMSMGAYCDTLRFRFRYATDWNGTTGYLAGHVSAIQNAKYGTGFGSGFVTPFPKFIVYEGNTSQCIPPGPSLNNPLMRAMLSHDIVYCKEWYDVKFAFNQMLQCPGPEGTFGFETFIVTTLVSGRSFGTDFQTSNGPDGGSVECWTTYEFQGQLRGYGNSNHMASPTLGGDSKNNAYRNEAVSGQAYADWIALQAGSTPPTVPSIAVFPPSIQQSSSATLSLLGSNTTWTGGSVVTVTNSLTGTTTVAAGAFTAISATQATLAVTAGLGIGSWRITIDGVDSPFLGVTTGPVASFAVIPSTIRTNAVASLSLAGTLTTWSNTSTATITNSLTGTTAVVAGPLTVSDATHAGLSVTTGPGIGTWRMTVDAVDSPVLSVAPLDIPFMLVNPSNLQPNQSMPLTLFLTGVSTSWRSGSSVSVMNSLTGTTSVVKGVWTALSTTQASLTVTTGDGIGTWKIVIDGVSSPILSISGAVPRNWFGRRVIQRARA